MNTLERSRIANLNDVFNDTARNAFFLRINAYSADVERFLLRLYEAARKNGVIIEGRIPNPTENNLNYFNEILGPDFRMEVQFLQNSLDKWLPRMNSAQRAGIARALFSTLQGMQSRGKSISILKNAYVKFMCWFYFKFERVAVALGTGSIPKVLYQGDMSAHELEFLSILCGAGCDIVVLQCAGDAAYLKLDPSGLRSDAVQLPGAAPFPANFSINELYKQHVNPQRPQPAASTAPSRTPLPPRPGTGTAPSRTPLPPRPGMNTAPSRTPLPPRPGMNTAPSRTPAPRQEMPLSIPEGKFVICPNAWFPGENVFENMVMPHPNRGSDEKLIYTCFVRMEGAEDRMLYPNDLLQLRQKISQGGRKLVVLDQGIAPPTPDEINQIRKGNYAGCNDAIQHLSANLRVGTAVDLQNILVKAFMEVLSGEAQRLNGNVNRLISTAVYLLCWFKRYYNELLGGWKPKQIGCLIYLGGCRSEREALFLRMLSRTPVDVLVLKPNLNDGCCLQDPLLFVQPFADSLVMDRFPGGGVGMSVSTAASQAERDLDTTLYGGTGLYRDRQFELGQAVVLNTTYEEIGIYWDQELKYRPSFSAEGGSVMMPVLFSQVSGIKNNDVTAYWQGIKALMTPNAYVVRRFPHFDVERGGFSGNATAFFRNGKLQREQIKNHRDYPFGLFRNEVQEHILNKLQALIDSKVIRGTFENGMEYSIISTVLGLKKEIVRMIQQFDFTKKNPKLLCINAGENPAAKEDVITMAFLSLIGFDVVCFVPTGYQCFSQWYNGRLQEHQLGDYVYDLIPPDFNTIAQNTHSVWNIFRRGR